MEACDRGTRIENFNLDGCLLAAKRPWMSVALSSLLHVVVAGVLSTVAHRVDEERREWRTFRLSETRSLEIRVPKPLLVPALPGRALGQGAALTIARADGEIRRQGPPRPRVSAFRSFELATLPRRDASHQTLLQPRFSPWAELPSDVRLPEMLFWSAQLPVPPPAAPKRFVAPGRETPAAQIAPIAAPPKLELPLLHTPPNPATASLLQAALPKLPVIVGTAASLPLHSSVLAVVSKSAIDASVDVLAGDASAILAANVNPPPLSDTVVVPPGNQLGRLSEPGADAAQGRHQSGGGQGLEHLRHVVRSRGTQRVPNDDTAAGSDSAGPADGLVTSSAATPDIVGDSSPAALTMVPPLSASAGSNSIRIVHPENGVFDMVVVGAPFLTTLPHVQQILSGYPIYTVYLNVGARAEWILQYCIPNSATGVVAGTRVIQLSQPAPVRAPYPRMTVIPPNAALVRKEQTLILGFLSAEGQFRSLRVLDIANQDFFARIAPFLTQWQFRPATRDGSPIELEVLLVIPSLAASTP